MIKVLLVGPRTILLEGAKQILLEAADVVPALVASGGDDLLRKLRMHQQVDVVVLAIGQTEPRLAQMLKRIHLIRPGLPVLVLDDQAHIVTLATVPADRRLSGRSSPEELVARITRALREMAARPAAAARSEVTSGKRKEISA